MEGTRTRAASPEERLDAIEARADRLAEQLQELRADVEKLVSRLEDDGV